MFRPHMATVLTTEDGRVRSKHVLIEFKKRMCYIDGQKNKYSVLNECNRMLNTIYLVCKFYSQKPHEALNLLFTKECYRAPFYMLFYMLFTQFSEYTVVLPVFNEFL
jgi:hypothetical protein